MSSLLTSYANPFSANLKQPRLLQPQVYQLTDPCRKYTSPHLLEFYTTTPMYHSDNDRQLPQNCKLKMAMCRMLLQNENRQAVRGQRTQYRPVHVMDPPTFMLTTVTAKSRCKYPHAHNPKCIFSAPHKLLPMAVFKLPHDHLRVGKAKDQIWL
jgi:hypothetical protein